MIGGTLAQIFQALLWGPLISKTGHQKIGFMGIAKMNQKDLVFLKQLLETGKVKPIIDRRYPLSQTAEPVRYVEEGHARGKVVIDVAQEKDYHTATTGRRSAALLGGNSS